MSAADRTASTSDSRKRRAESATVVPDASNEITHEQVAAIIRAGLAIEEADSFGSCDLGADIADALMPLFAAKDAEIERLRAWKDEAMPVMSGLQELGRVLSVPLGARITGPLGLKAVETLIGQRDEARAEVEHLRAEIKGWQAGAKTSRAQHKRDLATAVDALKAVRAVYERYFDLDGTPGVDDTCPEPEDVWRFDRDFRAAIEPASPLLGGMP